MTENLPVLVNFTTAGLGGVLGWILVHPFNTISVRMNLASQGLGVQPSRMPAPSFYRFSRYLLQQEGIGTLYQGLSAGITRQIFYATSRFGLYEVIRDAVARWRQGRVDFTTKVVVGMASGVCAAAISSPAEVALVRMSNDRALPPSQRRNYASLWQAARRILHEEGLLAFWRGSQALATRAAIVGAAQVAVYDQIFELLRSRQLTPPGLPSVATAAMTAGLVYSLLTNPFETAKNRMAFQKKTPTGQLLYTGPLQTIRKVAKYEGPLALWQGFLPYYLRSGGHTVFMFIFVEQLRSLFRKISSSSSSSSKIKAIS